MTALRVVLTALAYLVASALFILGLKRLCSPATARGGNLLGALGMLLAVVATLLQREIVGYPVIATGLLIGSVLGVVSAYGVRMTAMPQMVGLLNGWGGGASALVAWAEYLRPSARPLDVSVTIMASVLIGGVTFSGSLVAFAKLEDWLPGRPVTYPWQNASNLFVFLVVLTLVGGLALVPLSLPLFALLGLLSLALGVLVVIPIGGADMPVVISLLNSYSGLAAATTGFVLHNQMLIIAGALVGASGLVMTHLMCTAMHRSLANVAFGAFGRIHPSVAGAHGEAPLLARDITPEDAAVLLGYARSVIIVPGYGMAVAQAQHALRELADLLRGKGVEVKYAIHPVAGRMPGHMNVLLAEANVPYDQLYEMEQVNGEFEHTDVALVVGANDVVNPAARTNPGSPLYGMPILNVDRARQVIVLKRSLNPGFAGVENELFFRGATRMLFRDARAGVAELISAVKAL